MYKTASKQKLRFDTAKGKVTTEDLWDMPLTSRIPGNSLDDLARALARAVKESQEESFVLTINPGKAALELQFGIVKDVIATKLAEVEAREKAADKKALKERILSIMAEKQDDTLKGKSLKALQKQLEEL